MEAALDGLAAAGARMSVLSNKPDSFTKMMIPELLPRWIFQPILGARPGVPVKPNPQAALEIAAILGLQPSEMMYVGDTSTDMKTATSAGMHAVGVTWGFRTLEELLQNGAQSIVNHPEELLGLLYS
jgi:phosphoglycolate phosphatase